MEAGTAAGHGLLSLPESRRAILELIKKRGEADAGALAAGIGMTVSCARQHLAALERDGLVISRRDRSETTPSAGRGRPRHLYALTDAGDALFPRNYVDLTNELLEYVEDESPDLLGRIFDRRAQRRLERARSRMGGRPFAERVGIVAGILDEDGYLADFEARPDGTFLITEHNCAVLGVALRYRHACSSELDFLRAAMPEADVTRVAHRINGGHVCAYEIKPRTSLAAEEQT